MKSSCLFFVLQLQNVNPKFFTIELFQAETKENLDEISKTNFIFFLKNLKRLNKFAPIKEKKIDLITASS